MTAHAAAVSRWQVPVILAAVVVGTVLGLVADLGDAPQALVVPALLALLVLTFAGIQPGNVSRQIRPHAQVAGASLALNFLWAPALAGVVGLLLLGDHPDLRLGLVMLLVTPCTDWYLVFTATARGNVPLAASLLPINLVLQLALLPVYVTVLTGDSVDVSVRRVASDVLIVVGIPLAVAVGARLIATVTGTTDAFDAGVDRAQPLGLVLLATAVAAIFAAHAQLVLDEPGSLALMLLPLGLFFVLTYLLTQAVATALGSGAGERVALTMTALARNSPIVLVIAATAFADRPLVTLVLVVGPLVELPVLALAARALSPPGRSTAG